jgi:trigger factor
MQVSVENVGNLERKLTVRVPAEQFESRVQERVNELRRSARLKGFRPGRVPAKIIEKRYGTQVRGEALSELIDRTFSDAIREQQLQPVASPAIDTDGQPKDGEIEYTATFEVMPELPTVDVSILKIDRAQAEVGEDDIDRMIETLRVQRRVFENVERAAQDGDTVTLEYSAQAEDFRHPAEGREQTVTAIGGGTPLALFDGVLKGQSAGAELDFETTFPPTFPVPQLAGKPAQVQLRIDQVQQAHTPELDADFIRNFGVKDGSAATFRSEVRANLERELDNAMRARLRNEVSSKLAASYADVEVPKALENAEIEAIVRAAMPNLYDKEAVPPEAREAAQPLAHQRVISGLLLRQLAQSHNINVDNQRVAEQIRRIASTYEEPEQVVELYRSNPQMMENVRSSVLEDQVSEWVAEHADSTELAVSFDEVMHPPTDRA